MSQPRNSDDTGRALSPTLWLIVVLVVTIAAYARTVSFEFVYDDHVQVTDDRAVVNADWSAVWTRDEWSHLEGTGSNYYRPMMGLWRKPNRELFATHPMGWHIASIFAHLVVTTLVFGLALRFLGDVFTASIAALIFGVHPVHIESVAWVTGAVDPLVGIWFGSTFFCYLRAQDVTGQRYVWLGFAWLFFVFGLLTKEITLVLPGLVFVHQWIFADKTEGRFRSALLTTAPFATLSVVYLVFRVWVSGGFLPVSTPVDMQVMLMTWPSLLWFYVTHLMFPVGLSEFYDFPYVTSASFKALVLPLLGVAIVVAVLWWWGLRERVVAFCACWMIFPLLPALHLAVLPYGNFVHDRFLYVPSIGFALILAMGIRVIPSSGQRSFGLPTSQVIFTVALVTALSVGTVSQSAQWKNDHALFTRGVAIAPNSNIARNNLATVLLRAERIDEAIALYQQILVARPTAWRTTLNLGQAYYRKGESEKAWGYFEKAIELNPKHSDTHLYLGFTAMRVGKLNLAEKSFRDALALAPDQPGYYFALGRVLKAQSRISEALAAFERELRHESTASHARAEIEKLRSGTQINQPSHPSRALSA